MEAPVVDPFRSPPAPWTAGNRGLEYGTEPGSDVHAAGVGEVVFAGRVAGSLHVTIRHPDGIRTSYSFLATMSVRVGQQVRQGQVIGTAGARLHFGARVGDEYVDPALLFSGSLRTHVRLVPHDDPDRDRRYDQARERELFLELSEGGGWGLGGIGALTGGLVDLGGALNELPAHAAGTVWEQGALFRNLAIEDGLWVRGIRIASGAMGILLVSEGPCTPRGAAPPPPASQRRLALRVAGFTSTSNDGAIDDLDLASLGYEPEDDVRFSYNGGVVPADRGSGLPTSDYSAADTARSIVDAGVALARTLIDFAVAHPGVPMDVFDHSMGGLVVRVALAVLDSVGAPLPVHVVNLGSPVEGTDAATVINAVLHTPLGQGLARVIEAASWVGVDTIDAYDPDSPALHQLTEYGLGDDLPRYPPGVEVLNVGARLDMIVPNNRLDGAGGTTVVVDGGLNPWLAHGQVPGDPDVHREVGLFLAGRPPSCQGRWNRLVDLVAGEAISGVEDGLAVGVQLQPLSRGF